jgi:predicted short-subunit dehydrogenase-like oxidoreductase (DUF2520 family)
VFVMGAGRAGRALAAALMANGVDVVGIHGRSPDASDPRVSTGALPAALASADTVLVTVRDSQLDDAITELLSAGLQPGAVVLHASGSAEPSVIESARKSGHPSGTFHPLMPLASRSDAAGRLRGGWIGIDGDGLAREKAADLAARLGARTMEIPSGKKSSYHAAAVLASNFPSVLASLSTRLLVQAGVPAADAAAAVVSLMHASVDNLRGLDPAAALTGPVVRGDAGTVSSHLDALARAGDDGVLPVYVALTRVAVGMAREQGSDANALRQIEEAISRT